MIRNSIKITIIGILTTLFIFSCSNKKNTIISRNYNALTTHYNIYFNGKESFKEGIAAIEKGHKENYVALLPVFIYQDDAARKTAASKMERAIEKAVKGIKLHSITRKPRRKRGKKSKRYKEFRKKNEYNRWIDDCYLLMGKAQFYRRDYLAAEKTFDFIEQEYPESKLISQAKLWKAASLIDRNETISGVELLNRIGGSKGLKRKDRLWILALRADAAIKEKNYPTAIKRLDTCIKQSRNKNQKARFYYIIAQLYQKLKNKNGALKAYQDLIALHAGYEITFNANINRALSYSGESTGAEIRKQLMKMLKDDKNKEYQDQIYYALAEMDMVDRLFSSAIKNYWKATQVSVENDNQKAIAFLKLADIYFDDTNFVKAKMCYDSSMTYLGDEYPNYLKITTRVRKLTELVTNLNIISREDSLQQVAKMPVAERNKLIDQLIQAVVDKEAEKKKEIYDAQSDRNFFMQNQMLGNSSSSFNKSNGQGMWYFYNPATLGLGKSEFRRIWGRRKLEDNWRRKNKNTFDANNENIAEEREIKKKIKQNNTPQGNPKSRNFYLKDIPFTAKQVQESDVRIMDALYQSGLVYRDKLKQDKKALVQFEELLRRFPKTPYLLPVYYQCYAINKDMGNMKAANHYKLKIISEFGDSEYAKALMNPDYRNKLDVKKNKENFLYEIAFKKFKNFYYYDVIRICEKAALQYPESPLKPRFLFLKAIAVGRTQTVENFEKALDEVIKAKPPKAIGFTVLSIYKGLSKGEKPKTYTEEEMSIARQKQQLRNWRLDVVVPVEKVVKKIEKKVEKKVTVIPSYAAKEDEPHLFVLLFNEKDADVNKVIFNINKYNADYHKKRGLSVAKQTINSKVMVVVEGLSNKTNALRYFKKIINNSSAYAGLEKIDYRNFVITPSNLEMLKKKGNVKEYIDFYAKRYFNIQRKKSNKTTNSQPKKKLGSFVRDDKSNHKFVLLIPKKTNSKRIKNAIFNHDKDYSVIKESYDSSVNMLIVNNLGTKQEALEYMSGVIQDKALLKYLKGVEYRNFVISDNNFNTFYQEKQLQQYLKFFKSNYKITQKSKNNKVFGDANGYKFNKYRPHYFALVYPVDDVNSDELIEGIKDYNTRYLKVVVHQFDDKRDVLLVTNMQDKKQAMMYLRAIVTNRNLFKPIEKKEYRNFIISDENFDHLMEQKDLKNYMDFFKKNYLN